MKVTVEVPSEHVRDYVERARIDYWGEKAGGMFGELEDLSDLRLDIHELDGGGEHVLDAVKLERGLAVMAAKYPHSFAELVLDLGDAHTGDLLIQCAVFGDERYF